MLVIITVVLNQLHLKEMKSLSSNSMAKSLDTSCSCPVSGHFDLLKSNGDI